MTSAEEILAILAELGHKPDPEARTASELAAAWGRSQKWVRDAIRALAANGHVTITNKLVSRIDGRATPVPAYVIAVPKPKGKAKK